MDPIAHGHHGCACRRLIAHSGHVATQLSETAEVPAGRLCLRFARDKAASGNAGRDERAQHPRPAAR